LRTVRCEGCGFEYGALAPRDVPVRLRALAVGFDALLAGDDQALRERPAPEEWSALEYACHVRDVLLTMRERVILALWQPTPSFAPMGRDERVAFDRYAEQSPADVARQLGDAAAMLAFLLDGLDDEQWARTCTYNYPAPEERDVGWLAVHAVHEGEHHLADASA
jgi:hypothetical protein